MIPTEKLLILLAGAVGAVVPAAIGDTMSPRRRVIYLVVGVLVAVFVTPGAVVLVSQRWSDLPFEVLMLAALVSGLLSLPVAILLVRFVDRRGDSIIDAAADRVLPTPHDQPRKEQE